ncbi:zinc finger BED domain-containing protein RICESLEEPER 2-like [Carya illinoinensis]|uniref:zinc finger BED domain-containing protein RICESLEEPER 2-like n=1 Tax=Carya illinoinensis TaxID=32201 RepID=UPI001C721EE9|nr:zinc finger BED domain-containing protein RICESLEEPER 2-like [Carya illinoinensis]
MPRAAAKKECMRTYENEKTKLRALLKHVNKYGLGEIRDIVDCVRDGIKYLVALESRLKQFSEIVKQLQLPSKKLILDVPTRWNNTYLMVDAAIQFKEVFPRYGDRDRCFEWIPTIEEWGQVEHVCQLLAIFNEVTNIVSGSDYPTANLFLSEVWRMNDILGKNSRDENEYIKSMPSKSELDNYLEESIYICEEGSDASFDALEWSDWVRALYGLKRLSTNSVVMVILFKFGNLLTSDMVNSDFV